MCVRPSLARCIPNLDITVLRENERRDECRSKWTTAVCRSYSMAMAQQPKPAPSSKPKLKQSPLQRTKSTTDPDSIEEQLKASDQMRRMPSVYTMTDFWVLPMAIFGPCICSGCRPTLIQQAQMPRYRMTFERCSKPCSHSDHTSYDSQGYLVHD